MERQIIVVKPKTLSPKDKEKLTKAGNLVIEHEKAHEISYHAEGELLKMEYTNCSVCGDRIYFTEERHEALKTGKKSFYCPQGHGQSYI